MAEFAYNNVKNLSTGYRFFKLNYDYHFCIFFEKVPIFAPDQKLLMSY